MPGEGRGRGRAGRGRPWGGVGGLPRASATLSAPVPTKAPPPALPTLCLPPQAPSAAFSVRSLCQHRTIAQSCRGRTDGWGLGQGAAAGWGGSQPAHGGPGWGRSQAGPEAAGLGVLGPAHPQRTRRGTGVRVDGAGGRRGRVGHSQVPQ